MKSFSRVRLLATPWTAAYQAPPSKGFSRQEYWSGLPLPSSWNEWLDRLEQVTDINIYFEARNDCKMTASAISCQKTLDILVTGIKRMSLWTGLKQLPLSFSKNEDSLQSYKIGVQSLRHPGYKVRRGKDSKEKKTKRITLPLLIAFWFHLLER